MADEKKTAKDYFIKGRAILFAASDDDSTPRRRETLREEAVQSLEKALELGLPTDYEVQCLTDLANTYGKIGHAETMKRKYASDEAFVTAFHHNEKISKALNLFEKALLIDSRQEHPVFIHNENFVIFLRSSYFRGFGLLYSIVSDAVKVERGIFAAISYLKDKLKMLEYIPGKHMSPVLLRIGDYYAEIGDRDKEVSYYREAWEADRGYPNGVMEKLFGEFHSEAERNLQVYARETGDCFFCRYCGAKNKSDAVFCEKCGKKIT
jgi:tetratricopeptide (TPR) repeat protein